MRIRRYGPHGDSGGDPADPALVLIHGLSSSHRSWQRNLETLGGGRRLLVVQLFPPAAGPRFSIPGTAAELGRALAAEAAPVAIIGHSLGGLIAMQLAADEPDLVDRLVLVGVPSSPSLRSLPAQLTAVARSGSRTDLASVALVTATLLGANPVQLAAATRAALRADLRGAAERLTTPCLLVWGASDAIVPPEVGAALAAAIPDARLVIIEGAGHQPQWEQPAAFHSAVVPFLAGPHP